MNGHPRTVFDLDTVIGATPLLTVVSVGRALEAAVNVALSSQGLSLARLAVLHVVSTAEAAVGLKDLAAALGCAKSNASALVERMQRDGLLTRASDPADRRGVHVSITPEGKIALSTGVAVVTERQVRLFAGLEAQEWATLAGLLARISR